MGYAYALTLNSSTNPVSPGMLRSIIPVCRGLSPQICWWLLATHYSQLSVVWVGRYRDDDSWCGRYGNSYLRTHHECLALRIRGYTGGGGPNPPMDALPLVIVALPAVCASGDNYVMGEPEQVIAEPDEQELEGLHPPTLEQKNPTLVTSLVTKVLSFLIGYGWYVVGFMLVGFIAWNHLEPKIKRWLKKREDDQEAAEYHKNFYESQ
ncbi:hypothetical protein E2C01_021670 [Portunus trituberculatus]|uniref:Uncharacterized protein n=1 Tax=Portunus trituberculatus TaxID=210409 RepID=A0A5B7E5B4_PORTR|nr:hypothetical protein [Portunus trituberculatus]